MNVSSKGGAPLKVEAKTDAPLRYSTWDLEQKAIDERYQWLKLQGVKGTTALEGCEDGDLRQMAQEYHWVQNGDYQIDKKAADEANRERWAKVEAHIAQNTVKVPQNPKQALTNRKRKVRRGKKGKTKSGVVGRLPPVINAVVSVQHVYRFFVYQAIATPLGITGQMIAGACGGICTAISPGKLQCWASTAKIHSIKLWTSVSASAVMSPTVDWYGDGTNAEKKDTTRLATVPQGVLVAPPVIVTKPPKDTFCGEWFNLSSLGSNALFAITADVGTIIDLDITYTLPNNYTGYQLGITTGSLASVYYIALDGPGSNKIRPLGVPTTS